MPSLAKILGCFTCAQCALFLLVGHYFHVFDGLQEDLRGPSRRNGVVPLARQQAPVARQQAPVARQQAPVARDPSKLQQVVKIANGNKHNPLFRSFSKSNKAKKTAAVPKPQQFSTREGSHLGNIVYHMPPNSQPESNKKLDVFIGIASKEGNEQLRASIRKTYKTKFGERNMKFLFFMAKPKGFLAQAESKKHNDIAFVDVGPDYRQEPKLVFAMLHAALAYQPTWIVKSDENTYINYDAVLTTLKAGKESMRTKYYGGSPVIGNLPIRDVNSQFYESVQDVKNEFQPYDSASGGYILSSDLARCICERIGAGKMLNLHSHDVAVGAEAKLCGVDPTRFPGHQTLMFPGINNAAGFLKADSSSEEMSNMLPYQWNKVAAEAVGQLRRDIPDDRDPKCAAQLPSLDKITLDTDVLITFVEEQPTVLVRTLRTILEKTPPKFLKKIILLDDGSSDDYLKDTYPKPNTPRFDPSKSTYRWQGEDPNAAKPFLEYLKAMDPKIEYVKLPRGGFIKARIAGIKHSTAQTFTVMESHAEPIDGWLTSLLWEVQKNPKTLANPVITQIHHHSFAFLNPVYQMMNYNYLFEMKWGTLEKRLDATKSYVPFNSPVHAGGIFTMKKSYYESLLGYDSTMIGFSSENLDIAFQVWMCNGGGRNIVVPCSHVGHVYRDKSPTVSLKLFNAHNVNTNKKILIESWLKPGTQFRADVLKERNHDLDSFKLDNPASLESRKKWIESHCTDFNWFFKHVGKPTHDK